VDHRPDRYGRHPSLHNLRGLKASIFTDVVQTVVIVPLLAAVAVAGYLTLGGVQPIAEGLADRTPQLM
jgi:Na+/proline symporter